jgi:hypothetical protein
MLSKTSLLTALRKYCPGDDRDPVENFVTEAFAWLLVNHPNFGRFFLDQIMTPLKLAALRPEIVISWSTQVNLGGKFPDLVARAGDIAYVFEHKVAANLHQDQLHNYRWNAAREYGEKHYKLILITKSVSQHEQNPDLALCWKNVHHWINEWVRQPGYVDDFLFGDFCQLLEQEGLGPDAPVSHESMLAFLPAVGFEDNVSHLVKRVSKHDWKSLLPEEVNIVFQPTQWGRVGFYLLGGAVADWNPGLFVGFLLEPSDHCVAWMSPSNPDFTVIISFDHGKHAGYEQWPLYQGMVVQLSTAVAASGTGFEFHHQLYESVFSDGPNRWHPIHIRKPMLELLRGTVTAEDQERRVIEQTAMIIEMIAKCSPFWELRAELRKVVRTPDITVDSIS